MSEQVLAGSRESRRFPDQLPVRGWESLQRGERVEVWSLDSFRYVAYIDDRADDGTLIWVIEDGMGCRHLLVRGDPVTLYLI